MSAGGAGERVAVLIPCLNEGLTVAAVVGGFRAALPSAALYVIDNASTDETAAEARAAGAQVLHEPRRGKGHAMQALFRVPAAEAYVMVDGDGTYPAQAVHALLEPVRSGRADMVIGSRLHPGTHSRFEPGRRAGNLLFRGLARALFGVRVSDLFSGYRAFSARFVREVALDGGGFEIEAEMTIKAARRGLRIAEVPVDLGPRPTGSRSKLRAGRDGLRILARMGKLYLEAK
jgi:glycosyltransferase involved in cell wall biosynthesis